MADQDEADKGHRKLKETSLNGFGRLDDNREKLTSVNRGRLASEDTIKAVSAVLSAKKAAWARSPIPTPIALPGVSKPLGEIARRLDSISKSRTTIDASSTALEPPPVELPDEKPNLVDDASEESTRVEASTGSKSLNSAGPSRSQDSADREALPKLDTITKRTELIGLDSVPSDRPSISKLVESIGRVPHPSILSNRDESAEPRLDAPLSPLLGSEGSIELSRPIEEGQFSNSNLDKDLIPRLELIQVGGKQSVGDRPAPSIASSLAAVDLPREPGEGPIQPERSRAIEDHQFESRSSGSDSIGSQRSNSAQSSEPAKQFVRNPLSADIRNFSMASSALEEGGVTSSDPGEIDSNADEDSFGGASSSKGGNAVDLSKTNELLQQLIDAVRRQRPAGLPVGGPLVYPDR